MEHNWNKDRRSGTQLEHKDRRSGTQLEHKDRRSGTQLEHKDRRSGTYRVPTNVYVYRIIDRYLYMTTPATTNSVIFHVSHLIEAHLPHGLNKQLRSP